MELRITLASSEPLRACIEALELAAAIVEEYPYHPRHDELGRKVMEANTLLESNLSMGDDQSPRGGAGADSTSTTA